MNFKLVNRCIATNNQQVLNCEHRVAAAIDRKADAAHVEILEANLRRAIETRQQFRRTLLKDFA